MLNGLLAYQGNAIEIYKTRIEQQINSTVAFNVLGLQFKSLALKSLDFEIG